jgi:hypothetical protein
MWRDHATTSVAIRRRGNEPTADIGGMQTITALHNQCIFLTIVFLRLVQ